jgi:nitrogen fixation protein NifZ
MTDREARFGWGQRVVARVDLFNDGGYPEYEPEALLVAVGTIGEIVQVGMHSETRTPIYLVEFGRLVIGCLEEEIEPMPIGRVVETVP